MISSFESPSSSNIKKVTYDMNSSTMTVEFKQGGLYSYDSIPLNTYTLFEKAPSKGKYFHQYIKSVYPGKKLH